MPWTRVGSTDEFQEGKGRTIRIWGHRVAIFRHADRFYALDAVCPHSGADLGPGRVRRGRVTCPDHGWTFDLATGCMPGMDEIRVSTFPVKVEGESVLVEVPMPGEAEAGLDDE